MSCKPQINDAIVT